MKRMLVLQPSQATQGNSSVDGFFDSAHVVVTPFRPWIWQKNVGQKTQTLCFSVTHLSALHVFPKSLCSGTTSFRPCWPVSASVGPLAIVSFH